MKVKIKRRQFFSRPCYTTNETRASLLTFQDFKSKLLNKLTRAKGSLQPKMRLLLLLKKASLGESVTWYSDSRRKKMKRRRLRKSLTHSISLRSNPLTLLLSSQSKSSLLKSKRNLMDLVSNSIRLLLHSQTSKMGLTTTLLTSFTRFLTNSLNSWALFQARLSKKSWLPNWERDSIGSTLIWLQGEFLK